MLSTISAGQIYGFNAGMMDLEEEAGQSEMASGNPAMGDKSPAMVWIAFVVLLVLARVLYEFAG